MTDEKAAELRRLAEAVRSSRVGLRAGVEARQRLIDALDPATVLDLLNERDALNADNADLRDRLKRQVDATWEQSCRARTAESERDALRKWASAGLSAFHGRLCIGVGGAGAGVTDDARTCHDPKCVAWAKALEGA